MLSNTSMSVQLDNVHWTAWLRQALISVICSLLGPFPSHIDDIKFSTASLLFWVSVWRNVKCLARRFALLCFPGWGKRLGKTRGLFDGAEREDSVRCGPYLSRHPQRRKASNKTNYNWFLSLSIYIAQRTLRCKEIIKYNMQTCKFRDMIWQ